LGGAARPSRVGTPLGGRRIRLTPWVWRHRTGVAIDPSAPFRAAHPLLHEANVGVDHVNLVKLCNDMVTA